MKKILILTVVLGSFSPATLYASSNILTEPSVVVQGEPIKVSLPGLAVKDVKTVSFDTEPLHLFSFQKQPAAFVGVDLNKKPGYYFVNAQLANGTWLSSLVYVSLRPKWKAPLGIPVKLGGNTEAAAASLVTTLAKENSEIAGIPEESTALWSQSFKFPLSEPVMTDPYGYSRQTGSYNIAHKGADFRATEGTEVKAMNDGIVRVAKLYTVYGNTVIIDHGSGIETLYMHLSKLNVTGGQIVKRGDVIGLSGQTGYAESPHLHLSVKINNISVDPMAFMKFF